MTAPLSLSPQGYADWLADLDKTAFHTAQQQAALAISHTLVTLQRQIDHDILNRQAAQGWGPRSLTGRPTI